MGAHRGVLVTDPALEGSAPWRRRGSSPPRSRRIEFDLAFAGVDTSDGVAGVVPAGIAALNGLPVPVVRRRDRARRGRADASASDASARPATTSSRRRCRRSSAAPRRSASRAIRRSRGSWPPATRHRHARPGRPRDRSVDRRAAPARRRRSSPADPPPPRAATRVDPRGARRGGPPGRGLPRRAEAHLMADLLVVGEVAADGSLTKLSTEVATARSCPGGRTRGFGGRAAPVDRRRCGRRGVRRVRADGGRRRRSELPVRRRPNGPRSSPRGSTVSVTCSSRRPPTGATSPGRCRR